jgi:hypothetical protein
VIVLDRPHGGLGTRLSVEKQKDGRDGVAIEVRLAPFAQSLAVIGAAVAPERENRLSALEVQLLTAIRSNDRSPTAQARLPQDLRKDKGEVSRALRVLSDRGLILQTSRPEGAVANSKWWLAAGHPEGGDE